MSKGQSVIIIDEDPVDPVVSTNDSKKQKVNNTAQSLKPEMMAMPYFPYIGMPYMNAYDPMAYTPYGFGMYAYNQYYQRPQIPTVQKKLTEEEKVIEDAIANYYQKYSSTHKICECETCEKLTLPFMIKWDLKDEERTESEISHKRYFNQLLSQQESLSHDSNKKINNLYSKQIYLGELKFKIQEE